MSASRKDPSHWEEYVETASQTGRAGVQIFGADAATRRRLAEAIYDRFLRTHEGCGFHVIQAKEDFGAVPDNAFVYLEDDVLLHLSPAEQELLRTKVQTHVWKPITGGTSRDARLRAVRDGRLDPALYYRLAYLYIDLDATA